LNRRCEPAGRRDEFEGHNLSTSSLRTQGPIRHAVDVPGGANSLLRRRVASTSTWGYGSPRSRGRRIAWRVRNELLRLSLFKQRCLWTQLRDLAAPAREFLPGTSCPRNQRAQGMPGARCARSLVCVGSKCTRGSHHGHTGIARHSLRNGFNGFLRALPGDRACLPPSPAELTSTNLTPASGRQDHTTSPSASASFVPRAIRAPDAAASIASRALRP
jgi:hypothetical protein